MGQSRGNGAGHRYDGSGQSTDDCGWHCVLCARDYSTGAKVMRVIVMALLSTTAVLALAAMSQGYMA